MGLGSVAKLLSDVEILDWTVVQPLLYGTLQCTVSYSVDGYIRHWFTELHCTVMVD